MLSMKVPVLTNLPGTAGTVFKGSDKEWGNKESQTKSKLHRPQHCWDRLKS